MSESYAHMVAQAREASHVVPPEHAYEAASKGDLILDVREADELKSDGRIEGALNVPRGLLEVKADPQSPAPHPDLVAQRDAGTVHVLCASGGRAALAAVTLTRMGYRASIIEDGLKGWRAANLHVDG